jgi:Mn2+/Fe2+ NRAMP family transporter
VKKLFNLVLGVVTSIGGFVEVGSISTAAQAGAEFEFALLWSIAAAGLMLAMLVEMSGRLAAVSKRTLVAAVRERFGFHFLLIPMGAELLTDALLLAAEIGGVAVAIKLLSGIAFQWWVLPVGITAWLVLWLGNFTAIEDGLGCLGLVTMSFVVAAWRLHPDASALAHGLVPTLPGHGLVRYGFLAVSILGATVSPYLLNFYASGAVEEQWTEDDLWINRITSFAGMGFGSLVSAGVLVTSALALAPHHIRVDSYEQAAGMFTPAFGPWATPLFALALGVGCFGAAVEIALNGGYLLAQTCGWNWGIEKKRRDAARFSAVFTGMLVLGMAVALTGFDPLRLTSISLALTVMITPFVVLPYLVLMNDERFVGRHVSGPVGNILLAVLVALGAIFAVIVVPLEVFGG